MANLKLFALTDSSQNFNENFLATTMVEEVAPRGEEEEEEISLELTMKCAVLGVVRVIWTQDFWTELLVLDSVRWLIFSSSSKVVGEVQEDVEGGGGRETRNVEEVEEVRRRGRFVRGWIVEERQRDKMTNFFGSKLVKRIVKFSERTFLSWSGLELLPITLMVSASVNTLRWWRGSSNLGSWGDTEGIDSKVRYLRNTYDDHAM